MKKMYFKTKILCLLISFLGITHFSQAQEGYIEGPQEVCITDCPVYYYGNSDNIIFGAYIWTFTDDAGNIYAEVTTSSPEFMICGGGVYLSDLPLGFTLSVTVTEPYSASLSIYVLDDEFQEPIQSNAFALCPAANDSMPSFNCQKLCTNSTVNYWLGNGLATSEWTVEGAESWIYSSTGITVNWGEAGTGSVNVYLFNQFCQTESNLCVIILDDPVARIETMPAAENGVLTVCEGQEIDFINTSTGASTYEWNFGIGSSTETNPSFTYQSPGMYTVELIAYNDCLCNDTTSLEVVVIAAENPNVDCVSTVCEGEIVTYTSDASCGMFDWAISANGTVTEGGGTADNFVTIDWGSGPIGIIELQVSDCGTGNFCLEPTSVEVPIISDNAPIAGEVKVCKGAIEVYSLPAYEATEYIWGVSTYGTIIAGQGTNEITVQWTSLFYPSQTQIVSVSYENCYLECGGDASLNVDILPEYYVVGEIEVCENVQTTYAAINTQNNMSFACDWTISQGNIVIATINATTDPLINWNFGPGYYTLSVIPTNVGSFCEETFEMNVRVIPAPPQVSAITGEVDICPSGTYAYEAMTATPDNNFRWAINNGGVITTRGGNPITVTWGATAPYTLTVVEINTGGLPCESEPFTLTVNPIAAFTITGNSDVCRDQTSAFSTENYDGIDYNWSINPASAGTIIGDPTLSSIEIIWFEGGAATVDMSACSQVASFIVDVHDLPQPIVIPPAELCPDETTLVSTTQVFDAYTWKNEFGGVISTSAIPNIGPGYYTVEVTNQFGCIGKTTFKIEGSPESVASISSPSPNYFCGLPANADLYAVNSSEGYTYQWLHDGVPVGVDDPIYNATEFGSYTVEITDVNGCMFLSNQLSIDSCSVVGGGGPPNGGDCAFSGTNFNLLGGPTCNERFYEDASTVAPVPGSINWYFDDPSSGSTTATGPNASHVYSHAGFFKVIMLADYVNVAGATFTCGRLKIDTVLMAADFEVDNTCPGGVANFFDLSTFLPFVTITDWAWSFGDPISGVNNVSIAQHPSHFFTNEGTYNVTLTATADNGCMSTITRSIQIYPPPPVSFEEPLVGCAASAAGFIPAVDNTVVFVTWDFGDPVSGAKNTSSIFNAYHLYDNPGTYTVTLSVQSIYGCTNSFSRDITIEPNNLAGDITLSGGVPICEGDFITLTASPGGMFWLWSNGETTENIVVGEEEVYEVTVTDGDGCTYTPASVSIEVIPAPESPIRAIEYNDYGQPIAYFYDTYQTCQGEDVFLEVIESTDYTYEWSNGDLNGDTEYSEDRGNLLDAGNYEIFVTVTDVNTSCDNVMGPYNLIINPLPQNVQITASNNGLICESTVTVFSVVSPEANLLYIWSNGIVGTTMTTGEAGDYSVIARTEFACEAESNMISITAGPDITKIPSGCHTRCSPDTICIPPIVGIDSYQWYFNGMAIAAPEGNVPDLIITESGDYYVEMVSDIGCTLNSDPLTVDLYDGFGTIEGNVYADVNENGIVDIGDTLVSGVDIQLLLNGAITDIDPSDAFGYYAFENILSTDYTLELDITTIPMGLEATTVMLDTVLVGCDDNIEYSWLLIPVSNEVTVDVDFEGCAGAVFDYNGVMYSNDTTFSVVYTTAGGYDSTENVTVVILPAIAAMLEMSACTGSTIEYEGQTYAPGEGDSFVFTSQSGCDSTVNLMVLEAFPTESSVSLKACVGETTEYGGMSLAVGDEMEFIYVNAAGCDSLLSVDVTAFDEMEVEALADESCPNASTGTVNISVVSGAAPYTYALDGGTYQATQDFMGLSPNAHTVSVRDDNACILEVDFNVDAMDNLLLNPMSTQVLPCATLETELTIEVLSGDDGNLVYLWNDGTTLSSMVAYEPGTYSLQVANACESISQNVLVEREVNPNDAGIYVPNAFSPNDDGPNDIFVAYPSPEMELLTYNFSVFDRWGNMMYETDNIAQGWNGKFGNKKMNPGVYIWQLSTTVNVCGKSEEVLKHGEVVLLR